MVPVLVNGHVRADCPDCGVPTTFEFKSSSSEFGGLVSDQTTQRGPRVYSRLFTSYSAAQSAHALE
jgi:hypothetical protein